jgi:uncharacterized membrane protein
MVRRLRETGPPVDHSLEDASTQPTAEAVLDDRDRVLLVFAYLGPLATVSFFAGESPFVRWHARQGLWYALFCLAVFVVLAPFHAFFFWLAPFAGRLFAIAEICLGLGLFAVAAVCIARAQAGLAFRLPLLAELADRS